MIPCTEKRIDPANAIFENFVYKSCLSHETAVTKDNKIGTLAVHSLIN